MKIINDNPLYKLVLGVCIALGVTTTFENSYMMGICLIVILVISNTIISLIDKHIPDNVKILSYILIIGTLVTITEIMLKEYIPALYKDLGVYLPLLVLSGYAIDSAINIKDIKTSIKESLKLGVSYTIILMIIGFIREVFGNNTITLMNSISSITGYRSIYKVFGDSNILPISVLITPAGAFLILGLLMAIITKLKVKNND